MYWNEWVIIQVHASTFMQCMRFMGITGNDQSWQTCSSCSCTVWAQLTSKYLWTHMLPPQTLSDHYSLMSFGGRKPAQLSTVLPESSKWLRMCSLHDWLEQNHTPLDLDMLRLTMIRQGKRYIRQMNEQTLFITEPFLKALIHWVIPWLTPLILSHLQWSPSQVNHLLTSHLVLAPSTFRHTNCFTIHNRDPLI